MGLQDIIPPTSNPSDPFDVGFDKNLFYSISPAHWYQTFPFSFEILKENKLMCRFFLPIPPQNYTIQDMSTAEAHATIGGVVEEINAPVFSMITLVGTTGLSINNPELGTGAQDDLRFNIGNRKFLDDLINTNNPIQKIVKGLADGALSVLEVENQLQYQRAGSAVNTPKTGDRIDELFTSVKQKKPSDFLDKFVDAINPFKDPDVPKNEFSNGWSWSQALRQFFLIYQRERSKNSNLELRFVDYKSRTSYRCVPRSIQFQQNANSPYLINYTIILKCWDLSDSQNERFRIKSINRFDGDLKEVNTTTITGIISKVGKLANSLNRFPSVAGSFARNATGSFL